jgi:predicted nucleotidyltransferase
MVERLTYHDIAGVRVPVVPVEDNILLKALLGRGPEQGKHDWEDVQAMMVHTPELDWAYLSRRSGMCGPPEQVRPVLERLRALWRQMVRLRRVLPRR